MDSYPKSTTAGSALSLRAIRLLVSPVHLLSAAMWQAAEKGNLMDYETLGEIVTSLTETVPELLDFRHKTQLILGLRAKMILEMCRNEQTAELQTIQPYLDKIQVPPPFTDGADVCVTEADVSKSNFHDLVHNLLRDPVRRAHFFQEVFPVEYGPKYDAALRRLMWEFLSRLQQLLPVPDIKQTASWLRAAPNILNECVESVCHSPHLETILQHHQKQGYLSHEGSLPLSTGNCIFSCLSFPSLVTSTTEQTNTEIHSAILDHHVIYEDDVGMESIVVTDCAEVELGTSEHSRVGKESGIGDSTEPQKRLQSQPKLHDENLGRQLELVYKEEPVEIHGAGVQLVPEEGSQENTEVEVLCEEMSAVCEDVKSVDEELKRIYEEVEIVENLKTESGMSGQTKEDTQSSRLAENTQKEERTFQKEASERKDTTEAVCYPATETKREGAKIALEEAKRKDPMTSCQQHTSRLYRQDITSSPSVPLTRSERVLRRKGLLQQSAESQSVLDEAKVTRTVPSKLPPEASKKRKNVDNISSFPVKTPIQGLKGKMAEPSLVFASANLCCAENKKRQSPGDVGPDPPPSEPAHPETYISQPQKHFPSITLHTLERSSGKKTRSKTCPVCGKTFTRATDMRRHQISHTGERPYTCSQCGKSFLYSFDLKRHQRKGTGSSPFQCCVCGEGYDQEEVLKTHCSVTHSSDTTALSNDTDNKFTAVGINSGEDICNNKDQHKCLKCHMTFSQASQMRHHLQVHSKDDLLRCSQCWKKYPNSDALSRHMQTHNKGQKFQCSMCKMSFTQFICLRQHYLTSHKEERGFLCSYCPKGFPRLSNLIKHQRTHTGERPYQCSHCSKSFTQLQILTRHERIHTGERPFLCSDCGKSFLSSGELSKHLQCHSDARPFPCPQCDKTFKANRFLKKHLQTHTGERPFSCSHCGKRFAKSTDLTRHNRMHTGERPHSCLQCGKSFLTYAEVVKHQRYHTGERPFKCTHCGKTFTQSCYLTVHVRIHTGERPYRCTVCGRSFNSTTPLRRHMLTHTGEKPFKCSECGKAYNRLHLLRSHKQSHAGHTC